MFERPTDEPGKEYSLTEQEEIAELFGAKILGFVCFLCLVGMFNALLDLDGAGQVSATVPVDAATTVFGFFSGLHFALLYLKDQTFSNC